MTKREADFQIHNQPMSEAEVRAANMMNNQTPQKATPAQMAKRKIREAKGSLRRRTPGLSPAPTGSSFSTTQPAPSFFSGISTTATPVFGSNESNGVQQQTFTAPSSTFNFGVSTSNNPFTGSGPSNPFSGQSPSTAFGQQASTQQPQGPIFGQPAVSQPSSNLFRASASFNFGQSSGAKSSFPSAQNTSIFSKSTPASTSFTFGSKSSSSQTLNFGAAASTSATDSDVPMGTSDSPFKNLTKESLANQPPGAKPASPSLGGSTLFSLKPADIHASQSQSVTSSTPFGGSLFQPKDTSVNQQPSSTPTEKESAQDDQPQPSAIPNLFTKPTPPGTEVSHHSDPPSTQSADPFAAWKSAEKGNVNQVQPAAPFSFATSFGPGRKENQNDPSVEKDQHAAAVKPSQAFPSLNNAGAPDRPQGQKPLPTAFQAPAFEGKTTVDSFAISEPTAFEQSQPSGPVNTLSSLKPSDPEKSQTASPFNPFQSVKPTDTDTPFQWSNRSSAPTGGLSQVLKPNPEETSGITASPPGPATTGVSHVSEKDDGMPDAKGMSSSTVQTDFAPPKSPPEHPQLAREPEASSKLNSTSSGNVSGYAVGSAHKPGDGETRRTFSQTSNLFAKSFKQASNSTPKLAGNFAPPQSQGREGNHSPPKSNEAASKAVGEDPTVIASSEMPTESFMVRVRSLGAPNVPQELDNDDFVDFDKAYRLRSLNNRFMKQVANLDPQKHDFEPVIRFYAAQRAAIGYPLGGLYHRVKAGEKRKLDAGDRGQEVPKAGKRAKLETSAVSFQQQADPSALSFGAITGVSTVPFSMTAGSNMKEAHRPLFNFSLSNSISTPAHPAITTSNTSHLLKDMPRSSNPSPSPTHESVTLASKSPRLSPPLARSMPASSGPQIERFADSIFTPVNGNVSMYHIGTQGGHRDNHNSGAKPTATEDAQNTARPFPPNPAARPTLDIPKFASAGATDFMAAFAAQAEKNAAKLEAENKAKRKADEFDSDEDDEAEYERRVAEEAQAKRARIEAIAKAASGFKPVLSAATSANGGSPAAEQDRESNGGHTSCEKTEQSKNGQDSQFEELVSAGEDVDERGEDDEEDTGTDDDDNDDIQTAMAKSHAKPRNPFIPSSDPHSLFNRITKPNAVSDDKGSQNDVSSPLTQANNNSLVSAPPGTGLFGSRPSTPNHDSPTPFGGSVFGNPGSSTPIVDNTWNPASAIKFGGPISAPALNIIPATPLAKTNGNLTQNSFSAFPTAAPTASKPSNGSNDDTPKPSTSLSGASSSSAAHSVTDSGDNTPKAFNNLFGDASKKTAVNQSSAAQVGFSFGGPNNPLGASPLLAPSIASSVITSRATSPGVTDNESAAESSTDDQANDPQSNFMASRPGEENEDVLLEVRTKVLEYMSDKELSAIGSKEEAGWKTRGVGPLRVLRDADTHRTRIVMRTEPSANVVINSPLIQHNRYDVNPSGKEGASLKTGVYMNGKLKTWVFKLKNIKMAHELSSCLQENAPQGKEREK